MDISKFMSWDYDDDLCAHVEIKVQNYFPVTIEDLYDIIQDLRIHARDMIITVDLTGVSPWSLEVRQVSELILNVFEYTKNDNLLSKIQFKNAGFLVRSFYRPLGTLLPEYVQNIITFI